MINYQAQFKVLAQARFPTFQIKDQDGAFVLAALHRYQELEKELEEQKAKQQTPLSKKREYRDRQEADIFMPDTNLPVIDTEADNGTNLGESMMKRRKPKQKILPQASPTHESAFRFQND